MQRKLKLETSDTQKVPDEISSLRARDSFCEIVPFPRLSLTCTQKTRLCWVDISFLFSFTFAHPTPHPTPTPTRGRMNRKLTNNRWQNGATVRSTKTEWRKFTMSVSMLVLPVLEQLSSQAKDEYWNLPRSPCKFGAHFPSIMNSLVKMCGVNFVELWRCGVKASHRSCLI